MLHISIICLLQDDTFGAKFVQNFQLYPNDTRNLVEHKPLKVVLFSTPKTLDILSKYFPPLAYGISHFLWWARTY